MTRNEQILSEVQKHFINDTTHIASKINAFVDGAKWADETMRDKILMWLDSIDFDMRYWNPEEEVCVGDFIEDLRKVMEG